MPKWTGSFYEIGNITNSVLKGQRPIVAFVGSIGDSIAIQYVQSNSKVVGKFL